MTSLQIPPTAASLGLRVVAELSRADLGALVAAGLAVPPGFVVGAPAYSAFVDGTGLRTRVEELLAGVDVDDAPALERAARKVRVLVEHVPVPPGIAEAIRAFYLDLADGDPEAPVAVRSSATAGDTEAASSAGTNETFLDVRGADEVLAAVRRCWSSLFDARTIFHRAKRGLGQSDMDVTIVVQRQLAPGRDGGDVVGEVHAGAILLRGVGAAPGAASGPVRIVGTPAEAGRFEDGDVLVARTTSPDWVPLVRRAAAVATDAGGMTCHAAIVSRELGIPCVVGTQTATQTLRDGELVTVDATRGLVLEGAQTAEPAAPAAVPGVAAAAPVTATALLLNLSEPSQVARASGLDVDGVGLLRAELMLLEALDGKHPRLLAEEGGNAEFVERMAAGLTTFAAGFAPRPVTYRTTDFRTNEFRNLDGGDRFEPEEANPMIGVRGALRYTRDPDLFAVELEAIRRVWDEGHTNLHVMLPFVRTVRELVACKALVAESGLLDRAGFELWIMAEVPSVLFDLEEYAALGVAGISIGSNDLTQLLLGADRDSEHLGELFDERDPAVVRYLQRLVPTAHGLGLKTSICGQAPSVHPEYTELLVRAGIDAISVNIDVVDRTRRLIERAERRILLDAARGR
jgi:pyruvate,water dikinase